MIEWVFNKLGLCPKIGELWSFRDDYEDPFAPKRNPVEILEVKKGWVRYDMTLFKDQRMPLFQFVLFYKKSGEL